MTTQHPLPVGRAGAAPDTRAPDGSEIRLLATTREGARAASLCEVRIPPGAVARPVRHRSVEEIWHVTRGRGQVWRCPDGAEAAPAEVGPGDTLVIPPGWRFQFAAAADAELRFLCYTCPAWPGPDEAVPAGPGGLGAPTL